MHLTADDGPPMDVYVDTETSFVVKVPGILTMSDGRPTTLSSEFCHFRKIGHTVFPFTAINYAGGQKIAETRMKTYRINALSGFPLSASDLLSLRHLLDHDQHVGIPHGDNWHEKRHFLRETLRIPGLLSLRAPSRGDFL